MQQSQFLQKLEREAAFQAQIQSKSVMPKRFAGVANVIGRHTWKVLALISGGWALVEVYLL